jgi:C-terminal processing protease CtpA/Prc
MIETKEKIKAEREERKQKVIQNQELDEMKKLYQMARNELKATKTREQLLSEKFKTLVNKIDHMHEDFISHDKLRADETSKHEEIIKMAQKALSKEVAYAGGRTKSQNDSIEEEPYLQEARSSYT